MVSVTKQCHSTLKMVSGFFLLGFVVTGNSRKAVAMNAHFSVESSRMYDIQ